MRERLAGFLLRIARHEHAVQNDWDGNGFGARCSERMERDAARRRFGVLAGIGCSRRQAGEADQSEANKTHVRH